MFLVCLKVTLKCYGVLLASTRNINSIRNLLNHFFFWLFGLLVTERGFKSPTVMKDLAISLCILTPLLHTF